MSVSVWRTRAPVAICVFVGGLPPLPGRVVHLFWCGVLECLSVCVFVFCVRKTREAKGMKEKPTRQNGKCVRERERKGAEVGGGENAKQLERKSPPLVHAPPPRTMGGVEKCARS